MGSARGYSPIALEFPTVPRIAFPQAFSVAAARAGATVALTALALLGPGAAGALPAAQAVPCAAAEAEATPAAASPAASPAAGATPVAADEDAAAQIDRLVRAIATCQTERRFKTLTRFVTERFLGDVYAGGGSITKEQFVAFGRQLPRTAVAIVSVGDVTVATDGTATADVVSTIGHQLTHAEWRFVYQAVPAGDETGDEGTLGVWLADRVAALPVEAPAGADRVTVAIKDDAYDPARIRADGPDVAIAASNADADDHELLVLALPKGVTTQDVLAAPGPELPKGVETIGQITVPGNAKAQLVLVDLEPGAYAVVDLLPDDAGTPHLALGMEATLTVR